MKRIVMLVLCLCLLMAGCAEKEPTLTIPTAAPTVSVETVTKQFTAEDGTLLLHLEYPQLTVTDPNTDAAQAIQNHLNLLVQQHMASAFQLEDYAQEAYAQSTDWIGWSASVQPQVSRVDETLISVYFEYTEFSGGAHPNTSVFSATYNYKAGQLLQLADLMAEGHAPTELASLVNSALADSKTLLYDDYEALVGKAFADGAYPCWYLTKDGLCFAFAPYIISPYASGIISATISYEKVSEILEQKYL